MCNSYLPLMCFHHLRFCFSLFMAYIPLIKHIFSIDHIQHHYANYSNKFYVSIFVCMDFSSQTLSMIQAGVILEILIVTFIISFCHPAEMQTLKYFRIGRNMSPNYGVTFCRTQLTCKKIWLKTRFCPAPMQLEGDISMALTVYPSVRHTFRFLSIWR